ncbi:MAG TPA: 3-hydroxyacyl-CoA dehydrogenase NAD-binding domain-containing protein, partial [Longimicrobium sp.]|nr:3-hydroxyacyl-CoA dehydrogenase NAD-binding domain-containing protein [Longimicrobium sp.]
MPEIKRVAVEGAGTMGNGIVHVFAQSGYDVTMIDVRAEALEGAQKTIRGNMDRQIKKGALTEEDRDAALGRIRTATDLAEAVADADLVVEAATENRDLKFRIFEEMDRHAPAHAILASNTSSISITEIAGRTNRAERVIGMHFMNPVPVMKLVEIIRGLATSEETTRAVVETSEKLGKTVAEAQDFPGFVANRILMPMINEAVFCLMEGVADREAIDTVMKL